MDTTTVTAIIEMIENKREDLRGMFEETRPRELKDSQWVFKNDYVKYGADTALRHFIYELIDSMGISVQEFYENRTEQ